MYDDPMLKCADLWPYRKIAHMSHIKQTTKNQEPKKPWDKEHVRPVGIKLENLSTPDVSSFIVALAGIYSIGIYSIYIYMYIYIFIFTVYELG